MKCFLIILFQVSFSLALYSQSKDYITCWKVTEEKANEYFDNLFAVITGNDPNLTLIKLDFAESEMISVIGVQSLREYCKQKYSLTDSSNFFIRNFTNQFIRNGTKIPLEDTVLFKKLDNQFYMFSDSTLEKYRVLGVRNFVLKNCDGGRIKNSGVPIPMIAYLFENRIFWENLTFNISPYALRQIESSCKIKWDYKKEKWIDLSTNKSIAQSD